MTKPMPQTMTYAQISNRNWITQSYIPVLRGGYYMTCTDSEGRSWPCLNSKEWGKNPDDAIQKWKAAYGIRERKSDKGPTPFCKTCTRPICAMPDWHP